MSKHFSMKELSCHDNCGMLPDPRLVDVLERIRVDWGKPLIVNSCARCSAYNRKVGGARHSAHVDGLAVDLARTEEFLSWITERLDHYGVWLEDPSKTATWVHLDLRYRPSGRIFKV